VDNANKKQVGGTHYQKPIQHWDFVLANDIPYLEAVAMKYILRHREKGGREDLEKAIHYIEKMLEWYYSPPEPPPSPWEPAASPPPSSVPGYVRGASGTSEPGATKEGPPPAPVRAFERASVDPHELRPEADDRR